MQLNLNGTNNLHGLTLSGLGTHSSRTMMLAELTALFDACPPHASTAELRQAVVDQNVLGKATTTTRIKSYRHLRELYALDPDVLLYRVLRELWQVDLPARSLLALLVAVARDPALRSTTGIILAARPGEPVTAAQLADAAREAFPHLKAATADKIGRNAASSWTQSGHLTGHNLKRRQRVSPTPQAVTMALLLGHLCGLRGNGLLSSFWVQLLDASLPRVRELAVEASRQGWLEYRYSGGVTELTFYHLLGASDERDQ